MINIILTILLILVLSRFIGELLERRRLPVMVGEIMVGIVLGPSALGLVVPGPEFDVIINLSIFFIVFTTGMEFSLDHMKRDLFRSICISFMANNIAFFGGMFVTIALGYDVIEALFISCVFSLTALPVAMRVLTDLGMHKSRFGQLVISSSILDDLFSIILLSFIIPLALAESYDIWTIIVLVSKMIFFLVLIVAFNRFLRWRNELPSAFIMQYIRKLHSREAEFTIILLIGLSIAFLGELLGVTYIIGAFYAGSLIGKRVVGERVYLKVNASLNTITFGLFSPLFFAYIGLNFIDRNFWLEATLGEISLFLLMVLVFILFAFMGKSGGAYWGARMAGIKKKTASAIGIAMNSRGLMGLVIAGLGFEMNIINDKIFSLLVIMSVVTTLMTPILLKWKIKKDPSIQNLEEKP